VETTIRDAVIAYLEAQRAVDYPSLVVTYPNQPFDWSNPPAFFVAVEVEFMGGSQVGVEVNPKSRIRGAVYVTVYAREGAGSRQAGVVKDWFGEKLRFKHLGTANLQAQEPSGSTTSRGYYTTRTKVGFFSDPG